MSETYKAAGARIATLIDGGSSSGLGAAGLVQEILVNNSPPIRAGGSAVAVAASAPDIPIDVAGVVREVLALTLFPEPPIAVFPQLPQGFPVKVTPIMDTVIGTMKSLREIRVSQQTYPLWDIEILFEELRDQTQNQTPSTDPGIAGYTEYMQLVQLWLMSYGQSNIFAFDCPWDDQRTVTIGNGDGVTCIFPIFVDWAGIKGLNVSVPIGMINEIFYVQLNGVTIPSTQYTTLRNKLYFIDQNGNLQPPAAGDSITVSLSYYYLCRFTADDQDYEQFLDGRWRVPSLKFQAIYYP